MALCRIGAVTLKCVKPVLVNPCFIVPSSVNLQVRHAARKGYREQKKMKKKAEKQAVPDSVSKQVLKIKRQFTKIEKTVNLKKPEPPNDDVFIRDYFNFKKFPLSEAIRFHKGYHHPTVYNNPNAPIYLKIEINMTGKKETQFIKPFSGIASIPHPFTLSHKKEVLVFCSPEDKEFALKCGASLAGGMDLIKKLQEGLVQPSLYDYVICHTNFFPQLTPIRRVLKDQLPRAKLGTLTNDLKGTIYRFLHGIEYSCIRYDTNDFGAIHCSIGTVDMEVEKLTENFKSVVEDILKHKPPRGGDFITWVWCMSPPSAEEFPIDLSEFIRTGDEEIDDDDDDDDEASQNKTEEFALKELQNQIQEEKMA